MWPIASRPQFGILGPTRREHSIAAGGASGRRLGPVARRKLGATGKNRTASVGSDPRRTLDGGSWEWAGLGLHCAPAGSPCQEGMQSSQISAGKVLLWLLLLLPLYIYFCSSAFVCSQRAVCNALCPPLGTLDRAQNRHPAQRRPRDVDCADGFPPAARAFVLADLIHRRPILHRRLCARFLLRSDLRRLPRCICDPARSAGRHAVAEQPDPSSGGDRLPDRTTQRDRPSLAGVLVQPSWLRDRLQCVCAVGGEQYVAGSGVGPFGRRLPCRPLWRLRRQRPVRRVPSHSPQKSI